MPRSSRTPSISSNAQQRSININVIKKLLGKHGVGSDEIVEGTGEVNQSVRQTSQASPVRELRTAMRRKPFAFLTSSYI